MPNEKDHGRSGEVKYNARPDGPTPEDLIERLYAPVQVNGDVPLAVGSIPIPRKFSEAEMKCPCKTCYAPKRKLYCHSHCEEWDAWQAQELEKKEANKKVYTQSESAKRTFWRSMRWKR